MAHSSTLKNNHKTGLVALACLVLGGALLGLSTNLAKLAGELQLSPLAFLSWSIGGAAIILLMLSGIRGKWPPITRRTVEYYAVSALVGVAGSNLIFFSAVPHVGAGFVALIISLPPLLTYGGALLLGIENFNPARALGIVAALIGAGVLAANKLAAPNANILWILLALLGPVLLAIGNLYRTLRWPVGVAADVLAPGMLVGATVMLFSASLLPGFSLTVPTQTIPLLLITVQALVFAGQFLLLFILQKHGGPVMLSLLGAVGAVVGVPVAVYLQGEAPPQGLLIGALFIGAGVALVTFGKAKK
ncbi:MAG: DMT family transporter [Oceanisphaera sp.]|uniref:DMT family transporter n=1 Tax=Oceanisphaera sp. TaxID=1929979 RepID=UPI003F9D3E48